MSFPYHDNLTSEEKLALFDGLAAHAAQLEGVGSQLDMAVVLLTEYAGGDRKHWNTVIAARLLEKAKPAG